MPSFICEYDVDTIYCSVNGVNRSSVYRSLGQRLHTRGWERSQYSVWKKEGTTREEVIDDLENIASQVEHRFFEGQQGIFKKFDHHEFIQETIVRG